MAISEPLQFVARQALLIGLALALALSLLVVGAPPAAATQEILSEGPLTRIVTTDDLNCAVNHRDDAQPEFFGDTACGTLIAVGGTVYGPASIPAGGSAAQTPLTPVAQSPVQGSGTPSDPYQVNTIVSVGGTGLEIQQVDSYVVGQESYRTDVFVENQGSSPQTVTLYRAGDCFLQDSDFGFGRVDPNTGAVACVGQAPDGGPGDRVIQWLPVTGGSRYIEAFYNDMWAAIGTGQPLPNTCRCDEFIDNAAGLSWTFTVGANATEGRSHLTTFSPLGEVPLAVFTLPFVNSSPPGASNGFRVQVFNANQQAAVVDRVRLDLSGHEYIPGTTTGSTTADPQFQGSVAVWEGPFNVEPGGVISIRAAVIAPSQPGDYSATGGADSPSFTVSQSAPGTFTVSSESPASLPDEGFDDDPATTERLDNNQPSIGAVAISRARFADAGAAPASYSSHVAAEYVVLSRDDEFADSLAGAPLTARGPLLFTGSHAMDDTTAAEIRRLLPGGGTVYLLGGASAISQRVEDGLRAEGFNTVRLAGATRVETSVTVANEVLRLNPGVSRAAIARASGPADNPTAAWADSVTGGAWAAAEGVPILVTQTEDVHPAVQAWLNENAPSETILFGGRAALSDQVESRVPNARRVSGPDRAATAGAIMTQLWGIEGTGNRTIVTINGFREDGWRFGLASASLAAESRAPILMVNVDSVPPATAELAGNCGSAAVEMLLAGGSNVISEDIRAQLDDLDGNAC